MENQRQLLLQVAQLNGDLVNNCVEGVGERDAVARPLPNANNIVFLIAHLAHARYYLCQLLGSEEVNPLQDMLADVSSIDEVEEFPTLERLLGHWFEASDQLEALLAETSDVVLRAESSAKFPLPDSTVMGAATFLLQHEAFHLGQLALLRKGLGHEPMSYARRER